MRGLYSGEATVWLNNISFPFKLASTFLVIYYWNFALSTWTVSRNTIYYINKMKIPYLIIVIVVFFLEIGSSKARLYLNDAIMQLLDGIVVIAVSNCIAIFFFFVGIKVLWITYKAKGATKQNTSHITKVTIYIMGSGLCFVGYSIATLLIITPPGWQVPEVALTWWFFYSFFLTSVTFLEIMSFSTTIHNDSVSGSKLLVSNKVSSYESETIKSNVAEMNASEMGAV